MNQHEHVRFFMELGRALRKEPDVVLATREAAKASCVSAMENVAVMVAGGAKLSESLGRAKVASTIVAMVQAGEAGGTLDLVVGQVEDGIRDGALLPPANTGEHENEDAAIRWLWLSLSRMLNVGVPLVRALTAASEAMRGQPREAVLTILQDVSDGKPLVVAMRKYPELFPPDVQKLIEAGERNGNLDAAAREAAKAPEVLIGRPDESRVDLLNIPEAIGPKLVHLVLLQAVKDRASDVHFQPEQGGLLQIRYRIDGVLYAMLPPPAEAGAEVIRYLKQLAQLDQSSQGMTQDGRFLAELPDGPVDFRVSVLPVFRGDRIVVRLATRSAVVPLEFGAIGLSGARRQAVERMCGLPRGLVLVVAPCMCGKTTTMYTMMSYLNKPDRALITIEDPVEAGFAGMSQVQVSKSDGLTYAQALRTALRQAPNIIMVGDLHDRETAVLAAKCGMIGHLVIAGVVADGPVSAIRQLIDLGVEPYLLAGTLGGVISQRLIRCLCIECRRVADRGSLEMPIPEIRQFAQSRRDATFYWPGGCDRCGGSGYRGRTAVFSALSMDETLRSAIANGQITQTSHPALRSNGLSAIVEDALEKWAAGIVSLDEVARVQAEI